jgi:hypothetical protein
MDRRTTYTLVYNSEYSHNNRTGNLRPCLYNDKVSQRVLEVWDVIWYVQLTVRVNRWIPCDEASMTKPIVCFDPAARI